jgi:hypothetical protein
MALDSGKADGGAGAYKVGHDALTNFLLRGVDDGMTCCAFRFGWFLRAINIRTNVCTSIEADTFFSSHRVFGFLIGTVLAGSGLYYYVVDEYKISNRLLVEDIYVSTDPPGPMRYTQRQHILAERFVLGFVRD